ncbi:hypothetical protein [Roseateles violae]|uniref:Uncharacterized protein n=1 Tax=Roseateles violae TaxID=3058042 RepID=A0ABT8DRQ4_9BURK|nr:hypothetical protein [Pelomonas sp. PFR6]MDN3920658.1 hypothetical protein [Pelomonas sp. PFR6]
MKNKSSFVRCRSLLLALSAASLAPLAAAASSSAAASAESLYRKERADCLQGRSAQDRQTCLKEAGAALAEARRGTLGTTDPAQLAANAALRCQAVAETDRAACQAMSRGEGQVSGSVAQGGMLKEHRTLNYEPTAAGAAAPAASAPR